MPLSVFGTLQEAGFPRYWIKESLAVVFGSARLDLALHPPAAGAILHVRVLFGSVQILVPMDYQVEVRGITLFGNRNIRIRHPQGLPLHLHLGALFGRVDVVSCSRPIAPTASSSSCGAGLSHDTRIRLGEHRVQDEP